MKICHRKGIALVLFLITASALAQPIKAQTNQYPDLRADKELFKQYVKHPYPVRKAVFTALDFSEQSWLYEASVQSDTFYIHQLTNPHTLANGQENLSQGDVRGLSSAGEYRSMDGLAARGTGGTIHLTKAEVPNAAPVSAAKAQAWESLFIFRCACWYNLGGLLPETVVWHRDTFDAQWYKGQYPYETNTIAIHYELMAWTNNLPLIARVTWPSLKEYKWVEDYFENDFSQPGRFYPTHVKFTVVYKDGYQGVTNGYDISQIEFGDAELPEDGYTLTNFLPKEVTKAPEVFITSTKGLYFVNDKQFLLTQQQQQDRERNRAPLFTLNTHTRAVLVGLMILPGILLVLWQIKTKSKTTNSTNL